MSDWVRTASEGALYVDRGTFLEASKATWGPRFAVSTSLGHCSSNLNVGKNHLEGLLKKCRFCF